MKTSSARWGKLLSVERQGAGKAQAAPERSVFQQDYDRIAFSSAFRRMQDKTQVFPLSKSDYVRTRLTHSIEVSCVGRSLGTAVGRELVARHGLDLDASDFGAIVAAASLAHDIGNPPFGHAGEDAIREWFRNSGLLERHPLSPAQRADFEHYEGNAQGFRILTRLQSPSNPGLQLTSTVLSTFTKYPRASVLPHGQHLNGRSAKKFGYFQDDAQTFARVAEVTGLLPREEGVSWRRHPLAFLVEVADDVCYLVVDIEDAARLGTISSDAAETLLAELAGNTVSGGRLERIHEQRERIEYLRAKAIGRLLEGAATVFLENEVGILNGDFDEALLEYTPFYDALIRARQFSVDHIYVARSALEIETAGFEVLGELLALFTTAVEAASGFGRLTTREKMLLKLLPSQFLGPQGEPDGDPYIRLLKVADFVAGMTDSFAVDTYRRLKGIQLAG